MLYGVRWGMYSGEILNQHIFTLTLHQVSEYTVYRCTGHPQRQDITNVVNWALNEDFSTAYNNIQTLKTSEGKVGFFILNFKFVTVHYLIRPESTRYLDWGASLCSPPCPPRPCQDHSPGQDGGARGQANGRLQWEDPAGGLPGCLPQGKRNDKRGGENGVMKNT